MALTVKAVAECAGVSVRTLHHYDAIGLLKPSSVSEAGYRLYSEADVARLQQILFYRELEFALPAIKQILDQPGFDPREAMRAHRQRLLEKQERFAVLIRTLDRTLDSMERGTPMPTREMFDGFDPEAHREEASERWGKERVDESHRRVSHYTKEDWAQFKAEQEAWGRNLAALMDRDPADAEVQALIGQWYDTINTRFYDCSAEVFRGLGDLYVDDPRFTAYYEKTQEGLARFVRAGMHVFADRLEAEAVS